MNYDKSTYLKTKISGNPSQYSRPKKCIKKYIGTQIFFYIKYIYNRFRKARNILTIMKTDYSFVTRVENTPFSIIQDYDGKFAITIGNNVVSKPLDTQEDCIHLIEVRDWELFINSICAVFTIMTSIDKLENINNEHETNNEESTD